MMISPPLLIASLSVTIVMLAVVALSLLWWLSHNAQASSAREEREGQRDGEEGTDTRLIEQALDEVEGVLQGAGLAILRDLTLVDKRGEAPVTRVAPFVTVFDNTLWILSAVCAEERSEGGEIKGSINEEKWSLTSVDGQVISALRNPLKESLATLEVIKTIAHAKRLRDVRLRCGVVCCGAHPKLSGQHKSARVLSLTDLQRSLKTKGSPQTKSKKQIKKKAKKLKESPRQQQQESAQEELQSRQLEQARALWRLLRQRA